MDDPIGVKRVYEPPNPADGERVLVTRYWPRGVRRDAADAWVRELGTPAELLRDHRRSGLDHEEFRRRYRAWLDGSAAAQGALDRLAVRTLQGRVTLLTSIGELQRSHVPVLRQALAAAAVARLAREALERCGRFSGVHVLLADGTGVAAAGDPSAAGELRAFAVATAAARGDIEAGDAESEGPAFERRAGACGLYGVPVANGSPGARPLGAVVGASGRIGPLAPSERAAMGDLAARSVPFLRYLGPPG